MSDNTYTFCCLVEGDNTLFPVIALPTTSVFVLKDLIKGKGINATEHAVLAKDLILWKVRMTMASDSITNSPAG